MGPIDLFVKKLNLFRKMKELATMQEKMILQDQIERFLEIAVKRDHLQGQITVNDHKLEDLMKDQRSQHAPDEISEISLQIDDVIRSVQEIDKTVEALIFEKRNSLFGQIKGLRKGQKAMKGYGVRAAVDPRFIDRKVE